MNDTAKQYTSFWPVLIVFFFFTLTAILQLVSNVQARHNLQNANAQLFEAANKTQAKEAALKGIAHDLIEMAPTSPVAQQIVTDFRIQVKNQPGKGTASAPAPAPMSAPVNAAPGNLPPKQ